MTTVNEMPDITDMAGMTMPARYVGRSIKRINDPQLLAGTGRFVDDLSLPGMVHATILRSGFAHGTITGFDASASGALLVLGPDEIAAATSPMPCVWLAPGQRITHTPVASRTVRYVGQPIGIVVGDSRAEAEDYAEQVDLDIDDLPSVTDSGEAIVAGAPVLYPDLGDNTIAVVHAGSEQADIDAAFSGAHRIVERRLRIQRIAPNPLETRGLIARWDAGDERLTVWMSTQTPHHCRDHLALCLGLRADQVRVVMNEIGGGFGAKEHLYPDEIMVCLAAMRLGRPVKWVEDRVEHLTATLHGRDAVHHARLALDADGRFLALHSEILGNLGAHPSNVGLGPFRVSAGMLPGPYRIPVVGATIRAVVTNTTPTGAYRGFGMQEAAWVRERMVEETARELGVDPVELRLANMLEPGDLPYLTPTFQNYDSGDYPEALRRVRTMVAARPSRGDDGPRVRRGVGFASQVEFTGLGPSKSQQIVGFALGGYESAMVRMDPDGTVTVSSGVTGMGQGIETGFAQLVADNLGISIEHVTVRLGDSERDPYSATGSIASRSMTVGGGAVVTASRRLRERILAVAAHQLEIAASDLVMLPDAVGGDRISVNGSPDVSITMAKVAESAWLNWDVPETEAIGLEERYTYNPEDISFSYATHAAEVSVDLDTGLVKVEAYWVAHDSGVMVNPMICDGQILGGIAQGVGIALHEEMRWGEGGQPLTTTYLDYVLPVAADLPNVVIEHMVTPSPFIPGGMKGLGEGGVIPTPAAIANAVANAVPEIAGDLLETPLAPSTLWHLMSAAGLHDD